MFTVNLHLFGILLLCYRDGMPLLKDNISVAEIRETLEAGMQTLEAIARSSLMSRKGRQCLKRFLHVLDALSK